MTDAPLFAPNALLGTGTRVPLAAAAVCLQRLDSLLAGDADDRETVYHLRRLCLGEPVPPPDLDRLRDEALVGEDGVVHPTVLAVTLAAVHGQDGGLYLVSPFVEKWDRAVADLIASKATVRDRLPADAAEALIASAAGGEADNTVERIRSWSETVRRSPGRGGFPPPSV